MGRLQKNGALSEKSKELIALGIAISTRCEICIAYHVNSPSGSKQPAMNFVKLWK